MEKSFWKKRRALITGAEGFVGSAFLRAFQDAGIKAVGTVLKKEKTGKDLFELNVLDKKKLADICRRENIDLIIHCAALDGNAEFKKNNAARIMNENTRMVSNILSVAKNLKIKEIVIMSSAEIYAPKAKGLVREEDDYTKYPQTTNNGYIAAKVAAEISARTYAKRFGLKVMLPRPTNIYGPGDKIDIGSSRVIPSMISKILAGQEIEIWGSGRQIRGFIYITDLVNAIIRMIETGRFSVLNIAAKDYISIKDLAKLIADISGREPRIRFDKTKPVETGRRVLDVKKLDSLLDFKPLDLKAGLKKTIEAYKEKYRL